MCQRASLYRPGEERGERKEGKGEREDGYGWGERRRTEENSEHSVCFRKGSAAPQRRTHPRTMSYVKGTFCQAGSSRRPSMLMWGVADTPDADAVGEGSLRATYLRRRRRVRYESPSSTATVHGHKPWQGQLPLPLPLPMATQPLPMATQPRTPHCTSGTQYHSVRRQHTQHTLLSLDTYWEGY